MNTNSSITTATAPNGCVIRTVHLGGERWFVGRDVAMALGYSHTPTALKQHCRQDKRFADVTDPMGRVQQARVISADDVLSMVYSSGLVIGPELKRWFVDDLLGRGDVYSQALSDEETWASFTSPTGATIRAKEIDGEPWFVGRDIALALGYARPADAIATHCDDGVEGCGGGRYADTPSGGKGLRLISEGDMYSLVLGSELKTAKAFKRWVTHEVLPAIRRDGGYMSAVPDETPEQLMARALQVANATLERYKARNEELACRVEEDRPKVLFADAVADSHSTCLVGELAKLVKQNGKDVGQNRLFAWLRVNGYLMRDNMPTQRAMDMDLFRVVERTIVCPDGSSRVVRTTKVTGKGQVYFINKLLHDLEV